MRYLKSIGFRNPGRSQNPPLYPITWLTSETLRAKRVLVYLFPDKIHDELTLLSFHYIFNPSHCGEEKGSMCRLCPQVLIVHLKRQGSHRKEEREDCSCWGRWPAFQAQSPEFKLQSHPKKGGWEALQKKVRVQGHWVFPLDCSP
jgi:hypothetical protein